MALNGTNNPFADAFFAQQALNDPQTAARLLAQSGVSAPSTATAGGNYDPLVLPGLSDDPTATAGSASASGLPGEEENQEQQPSTADSLSLGLQGLSQGLGAVQPTGGNPAPVPSPIAPQGSSQISPQGAQLMLQALQPTQAPTIPSLGELLSSIPQG